MDELHPLTEAVIAGNRALAVELTNMCLGEGEEPTAIIETRLVPGMAVVGEAFSAGDIFVPEMLIAARAMKASLEILEPLLAHSGYKAAHTAVIGTVEGDLHDIGKNLVAMMWKGANIEVIDLGVNVPAAAFAAAVVEHRPHLVGMSALLTTTMPRMNEAVDAVWPRARRSRSSSAAPRSRPSTRTRWVQTGSRRTPGPRLRSPSGSSPPRLDPGSEPNPSRPEGLPSSPFRQDRDTAGPPRSAVHVRGNTPTRTGPGWLFTADVEQVERLPDGPRRGGVQPRRNRRGPRIERPPMVRRTTAS